MDDELFRFARLAVAVARRAALVPSRFARPAYAPAALFAALLLRERLRPTYRGLEDRSLLWLGAIPLRASRILSLRQPNRRRRTRHWHCTPASTPRGSIPPVGTQAWVGRRIAISA